MSIKEILLVSQLLIIVILKRKLANYRWEANMELPYLFVMINYLFYEFLSLCSVIIFFSSNT